MITPIEIILGLLFVIYLIPKAIEVLNNKININ